MEFKLGKKESKEEKEAKALEKKSKEELLKKETLEELLAKPISELTEDQIIEIGLKKQTKTDIMCYIAIGIVFIMIFIPPIFRHVFYDPDLAITEKETVYLTLDCRKRRGKTGYYLTEDFKAYYRDSEVLNVTIKFTYTNVTTSEEITPPSEVTKYLNMDASLLQTEKLQNGYEFVMDFEKNPSLLNKEELRQYAYAAPTQITNMSQTLKYSCQTTTKNTIRVFEGTKLIDEYDVEEE